MTTLVPAATAAVFPVSRGDEVTVTNTTGRQVVDLWAVSRDDPTEYLSMAHTRTALARLVPRVGDTMVSSLRRPMLTMTGDTSPGTHDTLIAACDEERYRQLGVVGEHPSCAGNFRAVLAEQGVTPVLVPSPLNLFMRIPWDEHGELRFLDTGAAPGDLVTLRAECDVLVVASACPMDVNPINGGAPSDVTVQVRRVGHADG